MLDLGHDPLYEDLPDSPDCFPILGCKRPKSAVSGGPDVQILANDLNAGHSQQVSR